MTDPRALVERLEAATEIAGKPIGRHMIESQRMIGKTFTGMTGDREANDIGDVALAMAACIENEVRLFEDLKVVALEAAATITRLEAALRTIADGEVPRSSGKKWREDGQWSKLDQCSHEIAMYEDCPRCIEDFARAALASPGDGGRG